VIVKLPTARKPPINDIGRHALLITGEKKTGKSAFAVQFPEHFMLEMELGNATHLDANYEDVPNFDTFEAYIKQLEQTPGYCKTLIIDEIQILYNHICDKVRSDKRMGLDEKFTYEEWRIVRGQFTDILNRIKRLGIGVVYTAHLDEKECELRGGGRYIRMEPRMSGQCKTVTDDLFKCCFTIVVEGMSDTARRFLQISRDELIEAYNCFADNFINQATGKQLKYIPMGDSAAQAYQNFISAFNNHLSVNEEDLPRTKVKTNQQQSQQRQQTQSRQNQPTENKPKFTIRPRNG
jgi:hypothetical protein